MAITDIDFFGLFWIIFSGYFWIEPIALRGVFGIWHLELDMGNGTTTYIYTQLTRD